MMRNVFTIALAATVLVLSVIQAHPGMDKECWQYKPTVKPIDCCRGLTVLPETALEECNKMYPDDMNSNDDDDSDSNSGDDENNGNHHHHHHHHRGHHGKHHCVVECYFNKTGVYKDRQVIKATALKLFADNTESSGTFQATLTSSIDTCIAQQEVMEKRFKEMLTKDGGDRPHHHHHHHKDDGKHCSPKALFFSKCVELNAYKNCPVDRKVSSAECTKLDEIIEKCAPPKAMMLQ